MLLHLQHILAYGLDGFAHAVEALAGGAYGARNKKAFRAAMFYTTLWAFVLAGIYTLVYVSFSTSIISILTGIETVQATAATYLPWILVSPIISVWSFQLDGIFIGTTRTVEMRNGMLISLLVYLVSVWIMVPMWANHGLWLSLLIFMVVRALTLSSMLPAIYRPLAKSHVASDV